MLKKNKKFTYVLIDYETGEPLFVSNNFKKINKFSHKYYGNYYSGRLKITTLDEYNKTHSEESIIDDMFKEWMNSRGNK